MKRRISSATARSHRPKRSTKERIGHFIVMAAVFIFLLHTIIQHFRLHHIRED